MHVHKPQNFWENVLWTDETKLELFGTSALCSQTTTLSLLRNMEEAWLSSGAVFLHVSLQGEYKLKTIKASGEKYAAWCQKAWSHSQVMGPTGQ